MRITANEHLWARRGMRRLGSLSAVGLFDFMSGPVLYWLDTDINPVLQWFRDVPVCDHQFVCTVHVQRNGLPDQLQQRYPLYQRKLLLGYDLHGPEGERRDLRRDQPVHIGVLCGRGMLPYRLHRSLPGLQPIRVPGNLFEPPE